MNFYQHLYLKLAEKSKNWKEEQKFPGGCKYSDEVFYIVRRSGMKLGLFSIVNTNLARIDYAFQRGMIPVIDMQNFRNSYLEEGEYALVNAWEKFFEQPSSYSLNEAYSARHILLSDAEIPKDTPNDSMDFFNDKAGKLTYWRGKCREYIHLKPHVEEAFRQKYESFFNENDKVLGVLARGTDYLKIQPANHPVQPTIGQLFKKVKEVLKKTKCNKIFLATEDKIIADSFLEEFGEICVTNSQEYIDYKDGYLSEVVTCRENDKYLRGLEYLINILILAKSDCIVAGRTSGTVGAALFSDGWDYSYFFDLGYYE